MEDLGSPDRRVRILLVNLALIGICILGLLAGSGLYLVFRPASTPVAQMATLSPRPTLVPSATPSITSSPTVTRTSFPSLTPTITQTPTRTGTVTPTATETPFPQLPAARAAVRSDVYSLKTWTPADAELMARTVQGYPESLVSNQGIERNESYYAAYRYAVNAWREALLRYPRADQSWTWRWNLAFDLARTGSAQAGDVYAALIGDALNRGVTQAPYLYEWLLASEPRLTVLMTAVEPPDGYLASYVVELKSEAGSAFVWLLEGASAYKAYSLQARFDFINRPAANWIVADLNGDAQDGQEAAIYRTDTISPFSVAPPLVFSLDEPPAQLLPFLPDKNIFKMGAEFTNYWAVKSGADGGNVLQFRGQVNDLCPTMVSLDYRWNGAYFRRVGEAFEIQPAEKTLAFCQTSTDYAAAAWGPRAALDLMTTLVDQWPPAEDMDGKPFPADARDEWLFRMGVYHALLGEKTEAVELFNRISTGPSVYNSSWIQPAQEFLAAYQKPEDIYRACLAATQCNPADAIQYLVSLVGPHDDVWQALQRAGIKQNASGYFDFDGDEQKERWFTTRYREQEASEFWILVQHANGYQALNVGQVENIPPEIEYLEDAYIADDGLTTLPAVFLESKTAFYLQRLPDTREAYLLPAPLRKEYPSKFFVPLQKAINSLLGGADPKTIQKQLEDLEDYPGLMCQAYWTCDEYYYYLGLASELAGAEEKAVAAYHRLWLDYSKSPYTTMARLKLFGEGSAQPTGAATPTPITPGPNVTLAPTQTPTLGGPTVTGATPTGPTPTGPTPTTGPTATLSPGETQAAPTATPSVTPGGPAATTPAYPPVTEQPTSTSSYPSSQ